jgi:uncharacterized membrane protein YkoI
MAAFSLTPTEERSMSNLRSKLVTFAAVGAAAVGGATVANAATSGSSNAASTPVAAAAGPQGRHTVDGRTEQPLSGTVATKVRQAALAKVSGTVERVETNVDSSAPYEAHIRKSDGTEVEVQVNKDYSVAAVNTMGAH